MNTIWLSRVTAADVSFLFGPWHIPMISESCCYCSAEGRFADSQAHPRFGRSSRRLMGLAMLGYSL